MRLPLFVAIAILLGLASPSIRAAPAPKPKDAKALVQTYMEKLRKGAGVDSRVFNDGDPGEVIVELKPYLVRGTADEKRHSVVLISLVARRSTDRAVRRGAVETLLDFSLKTPEPSLNAVALASLRDFARTDFSEVARAHIEKYVTADEPSPYGLWLAGQAGMESMKKELQKIAGRDPGRGHFLVEPYWTANLALARLGDADAVQRCIKKIDNESDVAQRVRGYPDLARTRHDAAAKYLEKAVMSDDELPPVKAGTPGTKIASYACEVLARSIEGFPLKADGPSYSNSEIETARKWFREQKTLTFKP